MAAKGGHEHAVKKNVAARYAADAYTIPRIIRLPADEVIE